MTEAEFNEQFPGMPIRWQTTREFNAEHRQLFILSDSGEWIKVPTVYVPEKDHDGS